MSGYLSKPVDVLALHDALGRFGPSRPASGGGRLRLAVEPLDRGWEQILSSARSLAEPS